MLIQILIDLQFLTTGNSNLTAIVDFWGKLIYRNNWAICLHTYLSGRAHSPVSFNRRAIFPFWRHFSSFFVTLSSRSACSSTTFAPSWLLFIGAIMIFGFVFSGALAEPPKMACQLEPTWRVYGSLVVSSCLFSTNFLQILDVPFWDSPAALRNSRILAAPYL